MINKFSRGTVKISIEIYSINNEINLRISFVSRSNPFMVIARCSLRNREQIWKQSSCLEDEFHCEVSDRSAAQE